MISFTGPSLWVPVSIPWAPPPIIPSVDVGQTPAHLFPPEHSLTRLASHKAFGNLREFPREGALSPRIPPTSQIHLLVLPPKPRF